LFIHQGEDTLGTGQSQHDGVELLGNLVDGVGKALGQLQEGGDDAQGDAAADAVQGKGAADHGYDHVLHVTDVDHDGHQDAGIGVSFFSAVEPVVVDLGKAL